MTEFKWDIKNIDMSPLLPGEFIKSPPFYIDESKTFKFCLKFFPRGCFLENEYKWLNLVMCRCDDVPKDIEVVYNLCMRTKKSSAQKVFHFKYRNTQIQLLFQPPTEMLLALDRVAIDAILNATCEIKSYNCSDSSTCKEVDNQDLEDLSYAYTSLLDKGTFSDVRIKIGTVGFDLHKAILEARSEKLARGLDKLEIYYNQCTDETVFQMLFRFLYSGKVDDLNVPDKLCFLLENLDSSLLAQLSAFHPLAISAETLIEVQRFFFQWSIENFEDMKSDEKLFFAITEGPSWCWLKFTFINKCKIDNPFFVIHRMRHNMKVFLRCKVFIKQKHGNFTEMCDYGYLFQNENDWKMPMDIKRSTILHHKEKFLLNGTLNLLIKFDICEREYSTSIIHTSFSVNKSSIKNLDHLAEDFKNLFTNPKYSDVTIKVSEREYPVHKAILAARSPVFYNMFQYDTTENQNAEVIIEDIKEDVVSIMLHYIYCGSLNDLDFDLATDLYYAANKYQISMLKRKCATFLASCLRGESAGLILQLADAHDDQDLKKRVCDFVCSHAKEVMQSNEWKEVMKTHPRLSSEVLEVVLGFVAENDKNNGDDRKKVK